jgi:exopolysaccharide biosynthesis polyprenyl glycosylphosphotransferase
MLPASTAPTRSNTQWEDRLHVGRLKPTPQRPALPLTIAADLLSISLAFAATVKLRFALGGVLFARLDAETLGRLTPPVWLLLALWLISAWWARLYRPGRGVGPFQTGLQIVEAMGLATAWTVLLSFALYAHGAALSRAFIALLFVVGVIFALALRGVLWLGARLAKSGAQRERVLIVGDGRDTLRLVNRFLDATDSPIVVCGLVGTASRLPALVSGAPALGTLRDLRHAVNQTRADRILAVDTELSPEGLAECIDMSSAMHIPLNCTGGVLSRFPTIVELTEIGGVRLLEVRREEFDGTRDLLKRATDVVVAGVLLVVMLPLLVALAIAITLTSPGPVLFVADRVGRGGRHFRFLKFRSMVPGAEALRPRVHPQNLLDGHIFKAPNDARITGIGRLMRRLSLDELPQLVNVIRGDMSLVGPRPLPACDLDPDGLSARYRTWSVERSAVRPGITGLWQTRGRSILPFEEMVRLDLLYVQSRSYRADLQILFETIPVVVSGRGAM